MQLKQQHRHLKVVLSIGGPAASNTFTSIASNPAARNNFAHTAAGLVNASGLDGVDSKPAHHCASVSISDHTHSCLGCPSRSGPRQQLPRPCAGRAVQTTGTPTPPNRRSSGQRSRTAAYRRADGKPVARFHQPTDIQPALRAARPQLVSGADVLDGQGRAVGISSSRVPLVAQLAGAEHTVGHSHLWNQFSGL